MIHTPNKNDNKHQKQQQKKQPQTNNNEGWWNSTTNWMKKKYFNSTHYIDLALNDQKSNAIWIFGMYFQSNENAKILYNSLFWFTYRENLKFYNINKEFTITSDVGWGCMIRVGQMMLAHCLRQNRGFQYFDDPKQIQKVIDEFISAQSHYSIEKIAQKSYEMYEIKPGDWYSPSQISYVLSQLVNSNLQTNLRAIVYDNQFEYQKTVQFLNENHPKNIPLSKLKSNQKNHQLASQKNIKICPGLIIVLFRIGYKSPQKDLLQSVIKILRQQKACIGILGGRPGRAHYLIGTTQKAFIYLDPHCVKQTNQTDIDSFFCANMFSIPHQNIDSSMGLCFYVKDNIQLLLLYERLELQRKKLPFYSYTKCELPKIADKQQKTTQFQLLDPEQFQNIGMDENI